MTIFYGVVASGFFVCVLPLARALGTYFPELFLL